MPANGRRDLIRRLKVKMPLYYVNLSFVLSLCCKKDRTWNSRVYGHMWVSCSVPNVITQHILGSCVSDITYFLFINVISISHLPEPQTTLHIRWSQFTHFSLTLCVTIQWPSIFHRMNYGGGGVSEISINRIGAAQLNVCVVLCCAVTVDLPSVLILIYHFT